ncbi:MAG: hypothetical protein OEY28_04935 [Nitrospira sp.]|nr:hypothetical protein [Nitrospira sp.]
MRKLALTCAFLLLPSSLLAGGSWEKVNIERLTVFNSIDYELVVIPEQPKTEYKDPYLGNCPRFTVKGTYSRLHSWRFPNSVNRDGHKAALAHLLQAKSENKAVFLGWMGTGFAPVDPDDKCMVHSRALELVTEGEITAVISYYDAT